MRKRAERHGATAGRENVDVLQLSWICLKVRQGFQYDVILIGLCEECRDLALTESVVECLVDRLRRYSESGRA